MRGGSAWQMIPSGASIHLPREAETDGVQGKILISSILSSWDEYRIYCLGSIIKSSISFKGLVLLYYTMEEQQT